MSSGVGGVTSSAGSGGISTPTMMASSGGSGGTMTGTFPSMGSSS